MAFEQKTNFKFFNVLKDLSNRSQNPFIFSPKKIDNNKQDKFYPFGFYEDMVSKEVRCPICLGRVKNAMKPNCCIHVFCGYCIRKWKQSSNRCPICRKNFINLIKTDITEDWVGCQGNLYAYY